MRTVADPDAISAAVRVARVNISRLQAKGVAHNHADLLLAAAALREATSWGADVSELAQEIGVDMKATAELLSFSPERQPPVTL